MIPLQLPASTMLVFRDGYAGQSLVEGQGDRFFNVGIDVGPPMLCLGLSCFWRLLFVEGIAPRPAAVPGYIRPDSIRFQLLSKMSLLSNLRFDVDRQQHLRKR